MDKALKQRLVGATVLIALAVIVLPMLLDGPPDDPGSAPSQRIELPPRPDEITFETRRFPLGDQGGPVSEAAEGTAETNGPGRLPVPEPEPEPRDLESNGPDSGDSPDASTADELGGDSQAAKPESGQAEHAPGPNDSGVIPAPEVREEAAPRVEIQPPPAEARPGSAEPAPAAGRYVVQVASLGSDANARRLMGTLEDAGLAVLLDTVESDAARLNRVRVGPYASESEANAAVGRVREVVDGVNPRVVDLRPDEDAPVTSPADPLVRWVVQVGSFSDASNAEGLVKQLQDSGLTAYRETVRSSGSSIHRVRVGPFLDRQDALTARQKIIDAHSLEGVVMSSD
ncbi:SPOR domain-containing protein [Elongatibacter sediminis]|uniref:SPOR domain-containing protein n=1 Tax=Elongatibacter sediminis TaxID=3119006 RepID=A0AAW9RB85_9GAMM